jgi:hypothetical protein
MARARTGWVSSSEIAIGRRCRRRQDRRKATLSASLGETGWDLPESETPCMCGTTLRRNWEISSPPTADGAVGCIEKPIGVRR